MNKSSIIRGACIVGAICLQGVLTATAAAQRIRPIPRPDSSGRVVRPTPALPAGSDLTPAPRPALKPDGRITLDLKDGSRVVGLPDGLDVLKLKTAFGEVTIPTKSVADIRFGKDPESSKVLCLNGDRLTGEVAIKIFKMKTSWGDVSIASKHILSVTRGSQALAATRATRTFVIARPVVETRPDGTSTTRYVYERITAPAEEYPALGPPRLAPSSLPSTPYYAPSPTRGGDRYFTVPSLPSTPYSIPYLPGVPAPPAPASSRPVLPDSERP